MSESLDAVMHAQQRLSILLAENRVNATDQKLASDIATMDAAKVSSSMLTWAISLIKRDGGPFLPDEK